MKYGIDIGHNAFPDVGASGLQQEDTLTKAVGDSLIQKLKAAGHTVVNCTPTSANGVNHSLKQRVNKANANRVDFFVSIHFNAFNGQANGSEVFVASESGRKLAQPVLNQILKLGFRNRGVKNGKFYVIRSTQAPAILIECCFCDSKTDMDLFDAEKMAEAIKVGLIGRERLPEPVVVPPEKGLVLKVKQKTILKPSTQQASALQEENLIELEPGEYPILDFAEEEGHYWVQMKDIIEGQRDRHFIFTGHAEIVK